jgi:uncharacterized protein
VKSESRPLKVVIPGGTGQVGVVLARAFHERGDEVVVLSRSPGAAPWREVAWDAKSPGDWAGEVDGSDVVINLAGRSVNCRYNAENRRLIKESRVDSTRAVGEAIARATRPPRVWLQAGTATIYAHRYDAPNDEATGVLGGSEPDLPDTWRFSIDVATAWERAMDECDLPRTRKVVLRSAMVMSPDRGGVFDTLLRLVRFGLGGRAGDGRQYVSWIHDADFVRAVSWLIEHEDMAGPVNLAAPGPLPYAEYMRALRQAWGIPIGLPATRWMLEIGTRLLGTESELVLKSRRVVPGRLLRAGFRFEFADWPETARDLCRRWRAGRRGITGSRSRFDAVSAMTPPGRG